MNKTIQYSLHPEALMSVPASPPAAPAPSRRLPPGPRGHWLMGNTNVAINDPLNFYTRCQREYGDVVRVRFIAGVDAYLVTHPEGVEHVLQKNAKNYRKPDLFNRPVARLAGWGILTSEGEHWKRQRRLMQPAFHRPQLAALGPV